MNNIKKIYQYAGKCDYQQNIKDIIDAAILSTPDNTVPNTPTINKFLETTSGSEMREWFDNIILKEN